jgi:hypothetical protein
LVAAGRKKILALISATILLDGLESVTPLIIAYFDASGHPADTDVVSIGGLVSTAEKWFAFSAQWRECLEAFGASLTGCPQRAQ